jgi:hypothetical protein
LIEIGREPRLTSAFRRLSEVMGGMAALVLLVWLIRGLVGIQPYSLYLLLASFGFIFLGRVFDTKTNAGAGRAVSSFLWNLTAVSIIVVLLIWFLGWIAGIQSDVLPPVVSSKIPDLVIAAVVTGLGAYAAGKLSRGPRYATASQHAFVINEGKGPSMGEAKLSVKHDTVGLPIKRSGLTFGCVLLGDVSASFETPMGMVSASLGSPVTTMGIPFQGNRIGDAEAVKLTGKTPKQLASETEVDPTIRFRRHDWGRHGHYESVDLPFIHVHEDGVEEVVEVGPIKVREGPGGGHVKLGPFEFDSEGKPNYYGRWLAKGAGDSYVRRDGREVSAKWNGSSLSLDGNSMALTVGSDSFSYSPTEVKTSSPLHTLRVTQDKVTLDTRKFTLNISGDKVILRREDKTTSTDSKALAGDLRTLLTETAKSQVRDVMEGAPIDLSEMLTSTEEVLSKHG